ncbi:hypothetical protein EMIT0P218_150021 [Pseudomonas sp. IT-P218]|jgi:hypothetical protein
MSVKPDALFVPLNIAVLTVSDAPQIGASLRDTGVSNVNLWERACSR